MTLPLFKELNTDHIDRDISSPDPVADVGQLVQAQAQLRTRTTNQDLNLTSRPGPPPEMPPASRPHSPVSFSSQSGVNGNSMPAEEGDPFDYQATVNELTIQFLSEFEETRVAALKWLIMLHQKAPKKVCDSFVIVSTSRV